MLTVHPHISGTPGRIGLLREILTRVRSCEDVWVEPGSGIANWWRERNGAAGQESVAGDFLSDAGWAHY